MAIGDFMGSGYDFSTAATPSNQDFFGMPPSLSPNVQATFASQPANYWNMARLAGMGDYASLPQFQRAASQGFTPALGKYLMSGQTVPFASYIGDPSLNVTDAQRIGQWGDVVAAARSFAPGQQPTNLTERALGLRGVLSGEDARRNALAIAASKMGGGIGYLADARQRALGNMYDLYSAKAAAAGSTPATFLSYLNDMLYPTTASGGGAASGGGGGQGSFYSY